MAGGAKTRADDERILQMVDLRRRGMTLRQIGARLGLTAPAVVKATRKVRAADTAESGEPIKVVDRGYWREGRW